MRKIEIIEIENSFLNFFTPGVLVPASYFLFNLIAWPSLFLRYLITESRIDIDLNLVHSFFSILFMVLTCSILYYILIYLPRLKVHDSDYKKPSKLSFGIVGIFLCIFLLIDGVIIGIYEFYFGYFEIHLTSLFPVYLMEQDPFYFLVFFVYNIILFSLFTEIVFRRALIPLLEDRGASPLHAVLLSALGGSFIDLPAFFIRPEYPYDIYTFVMMIIFGICAGLIFIATRNILFPFIFSILYQLYKYFGFFLQGETNLVLELTDFILPLSGLAFIVYILYMSVVKHKKPKLIKIVKIPSNPNIMKGILGYFGISIGLLTIQAIVVKIGHIIFDTDFVDPFPEYFFYIMVFYAIAFSIPFFLTISTQWANDPTN